MISTIRHLISTDISHVDQNIHFIFRIFDEDMFFFFELCCYHRDGRRNIFTYIYIYIYSEKKRGRKVHDWHIFHVSKWDEKSCKSSVSERYTIQENTWNQTIRRTDPFWDPCLKLLRSRFVYADVYLDPHMNNMLSSISLLVTSRLLNI